MIIYDELYRDNFINDQVDFESMFPEPSALCRVVVRIIATREGYGLFFIIGLANFGKHLILRRYEIG